MSRDLYIREKHDVFIEEVNKIALSAKDLICKKEEIKCNNTTRPYKYDLLWLYYKKTNIDE